MEGCRATPVRVRFPRPPGHAAVNFFLAFSLLLVAVLLVDCLCSFLLAVLCLKIIGPNSDLFLGGEDSYRLSTFFQAKILQRPMKTKKNSMIREIKLQKNTKLKKFSRFSLLLLLLLRRAAFLLSPAAHRPAAFVVRCTLYCCTITRYTSHNASYQWCRH